MGAAGAGKTTVGTALASELGWTFVDADALHSAENIEKMRAGIALTDDDRMPWLLRTRDLLRSLSQTGANAIVASSALREMYRRILREDAPDVKWVFLDADREVLATRLREREGHFAGPEIVDSQLATLEPPCDALRLDARLPVEALVAAIRSWIR